MSHVTLTPSPAASGPHTWHLPKPVPAQTLTSPTRRPKFAREGWRVEEAGCETKQIFYLQSSLGPFLVAYLFAGLLFQLHGQAQGLDDIWKEGVGGALWVSGGLRGPFPSGQKRHPPAIPTSQG